jgi:hypothetical protein
MCLSVHFFLHTLALLTDSFRGFISCTLLFSSLLIHIITRITMTRTSSLWKDTDGPTFELLGSRVAPVSKEVAQPYLSSYSFPSKKTLLSIGDITTSSKICWLFFSDVFLLAILLTRVYVLFCILIVSLSIQVLESLTCDPSLRVTDASFLLRSII